MKNILFSFLLAVSSLMSAYAQPEGFVNRYDQVHAAFSATYPFGQWKAVNWNAINARIRPKIEAAESANDTVAFLIAMREYAYSVPDGHISIRHGMEDHKEIARYRQIGGSYGFTLIRLDDGRYVARLVDPGSPAAQAGMKFGAEIQEVNGHPIAQVLDTVSVIWSEVIPATLEARGLNQCRLVGRAPVGRTMEVKYRNRGTSEPVTCQLVAVDDHYSSYDQTSLSPLEPGPVVSWKTTGDKGYGYLKITTEGAGDDAGVLKIYSDFKAAIVALNDLNVPGLVLDVRANTGGMDDLSAAISGFFYSDTVLYEYQTFFNLNTGTIDLMPDRIRYIDPATVSYKVNPDYPPGALFIEPQGVRFSKPVMVMTGPRSISSGEGIPMAIQKLPQGKVVSFYGSNASFGMVSFSLNVMEDLVFSYPYGQSLDKDFRIQLDSDSTMTGGVMPDIRVPLNDQTIDQLFIDSVDVELNYAMKQLDQILTNGGAVPLRSGLSLSANYPNPFRGSTTFSYELPADGPVTLTISDLTGRMVRILVDRRQQAGRHQVSWDAGDVEPGIYIFRLISGGESREGKCLFEK